MAKETATVAVMITISIVVVEYFMDCNRYILLAPPGSSVRREACVHIIPNSRVLLKNHQQIGTSAPVGARGERSSA